MCSIAKVTHDWSACFCFQWKIHSCYNSHTTIRELRLKELHQYKIKYKRKTNQRSNIDVWHAESGDNGEKYIISFPSF